MGMQYCYSDRFNRNLFIIKFVKKLNINLMSTLYAKLKTAFIIALFINSLSSVAQTVIYSENFNGPSHTWTLNTTDVNSSPAPTPTNFNYWIVNNNYTGGSNNAGTCLGFIPITYTAVNTPTQPAGITGGPTSNYMHMTAVGQTLNAVYLGVDNICVNAFNYFTRMTNDISTVGFSTVTLKFWWIGTGADQSKLELYYSTNQGSSWTMVTSPVNDFSQNASWVQHEVSIPAFAEQSTIRFGFRLRNQISSEIYPGSIGYGIDDFEVIGSSSAQPNAINTGNISPLSYCTGQTVNVPFTATGNYGAGNVFTAQLSNASGSFASPVNIGTLSSSTSGTIVATIPAGMASGTGYRIRVVSSDPATTGDQNTSNITITEGQAQTIGVTPSSPASFCVGTSVTLTAATGFNNYVWSTGATGTSITVSAAGTYSVTAQSSDGCGTASSGPIVVNEISIPVPSFTYTQVNDSYTVSFTNTSQDGVSYLWNFGGGNTSTQENPSFNFPFDGTYTVTLTVTNACGTNEISIQVIVEKLSIHEIDPELAAVNLFPNPASAFTMLQGETTKPALYVLEIQNLLGQVIHRESFTVFGAWTKNIATSGLSKGVYNISLTSDKARLSKKLILQ
jgi:PKD repeat protein